MALAPTYHYYASAYTPEFAATGIEPAPLYMPVVVETPYLRTVVVQDLPRRAGDPARLVADASRIREQLGWKPQYADLATIVAHAWRWELKVAASAGR